MNPPAAIASGSPAASTQTAVAGRDDGGSRGAAARSSSRDEWAGLLNPVSMARALLRQRELISQFTRREIASRTRGTQLGWLWLVLNPLVTVAIFTFVFNMILQSRWDKLGGQPAEFPLTLLLGTALFAIFADTLNEAPHQVVMRPNYVTKVIFPLEIFPVCVLLTSLFFQLITVGLVLVAAAALMGTFSSTIYLFPVALLPMLLWSLGLGWLLASLGVFIRDIRHVVALGVSRLLMFLTPLFYQVEKVPRELRWLIEMNPLTSMVENGRRTLLWSEQPDWMGWAWTTGLGLLILMGGYAFFQRSKRGFADVL